MTDASTDEPEVLVEQRGQLGLLTLNRPRAINALTHDMVRVLSETLTRWRDDDTVARVAITGAGDRGLCAGGDVVSLYQSATTGDLAGPADFWRDEYRMNALIARYPKPVVAIQDGLVLGGGIGVSAHASHRVVTERSRLGFPETTIGFVPDVGATWLLSRAPGGSGIRLGLTAEHIGAADAIHIGFSDVFVPSDRLPALLSGLESEEPAAALAMLAQDAGPSPLAAEMTEQADAFAQPTVARIVDALRQHGGSAVADRILSKSPLALAVTLEALRRALSLEDLEDALAQEFIVSMNALRAPDFAEGVRAQLVDKDRNPRWQPAALAGVTLAEVEAFFVPGPAGTLALRTPSKETA